MQDSVIQQVKDKIDIVEVVGGYLKLQKTGINYRAVCPFHSDKKPSFFVSPTRQLFKCFGCGEFGSVFDFIMKIEGIEFGDALKILAQRAGIELRTYKPELKTVRTELYDIGESACRFFEKQLQSSRIGGEVKNYLRKRGLNDESIKKWRLGYAPDSWQALSDFLVSRGYTRERIVEAGMAVESERGKEPYDRFRDRIIFPVFDINSRVIGFGGRAREGLDETVKYLNTPNTLLYDKSQVLYGLNFGRMEIRNKGFAILCEGYVDVILAHQIGSSNTVATSGTSLTPYHLKLLKRYTSKLYSAFDMDTAGNLATQRSIDLAQKDDFELKVISLPQGADPADVISKEPESWQSAVETAEDIFTFYFKSAFSRFDKETPDGKRQISQVLLSKIEQIPNRILQAHWIQKLASAIRVKEEAVWEEMKKLVKRESGKNKTVGSKQAPALEKIDSFGSAGHSAIQRTRKQLLEERLLGLILKDSDNLKLLTDELLPFVSPEMEMIFSCFRKEMTKLFSMEQGEKRLKETERILRELEETENLKDILGTASLMAEADSFFETKDDLRKEAEICFAELKKFGLKNRLETISQQIQEAETAGDQKKLKDLIGEFTETTKQLANGF